MKKLYRKGTVHPSPPLVSDHLSFLPATILTLTVALSPQDREVLAYLISCSSSNYSGGNRRGSARTSSNYSCVDHPPSFNCYCFRCYTSYWVRWDSSPNRQLIHEIIDAYEEGLSVQNKKEKGRKERRKSRGLKGSELSPSNKEFTQSENSVEENSPRSTEVADDGREAAAAAASEEEESGKGSVRRFVSFLGEKIWGVWT